MNESEVIQLVRRVIAEILPPILMGTIVSNQDDYRSTIRRFPNEAPRPNVRLIQPFGLAGKPMPGTQAFIVPAGNDHTNQNILGHFDQGRPPLADGDVALYDAHGHVLYLSSGKIQLGSESSAENMVLGKVFQDFEQKILKLIAEHKHTGNLGYVTTPPDNAIQIMDLKASPIDDGKILSDVAFTEKGGS